ncbi:glycosyltransferase family 4 protein [Leifsonia sp. TF02-11]|uniref:glycosyltransferase family 4 protein n=1 Tax=Leifsonia sp. TF02-11 TaxID=2815212 RepID=UPI001AA0C989|nr:glycosyltransferase family 4 protein [Leifsonia sp. TF02-11]MBO1739140.1 glycosyltransferase family 4 protein [Leifsonia sp. TF02-11]
MPDTLIARFSRLRRLGSTEAARRVLQKLSARLSDGEPDLPISPEDIADSVTVRARLESLPLPARAERIRIGWVCTPPAAGSGGHTTLFGMVAALAERGADCTLFLYDRDGADISRHLEVLRTSWPTLRVAVADARSGIRDVDACVASSWETAHVLASRLRVRVPVFYLAQDFEPYFYPKGSLATLAEDTYRFGFDTIALGHMVGGELERIGVPSVVAPFGCDTDVYRPSELHDRPGVVLYARPGVDRRGYLVAKLALERFHAARPDVPIHLYGAPVTGWTIPYEHHGKLSPAELNALYNRCSVGLALSYTNISLVAEEMLAAGVVAVVNDSPLARADLSNPGVAWAFPTPQGIADALERVVDDPPKPDDIVRMADSVRRGWGPAQAIVSDRILSAVTPSSPSPVPPTGHFDVLS